ncbi:MAG: rhamnulokinase [Lentisphaerae bacterium]|nr:rhamnulokinase [Lentisphaerota bacterium]MCP4100280.1 rhamnulokinase [Lentisphaerota bacterium]
MAKNYLAFDLGASSGRGIIGTLEDGKLSLKEIHRFVNGPQEKNDSLFWDFKSICNEIKAGLKKAFAENPDISSIGIDTWGVDYVLFDRDTGKVKCQPYNYRDPRTDDIWLEVEKTISLDAVYARTGIQYMQLNTLYQLVAHNQQRPQDFDNAVLLFIPDALTYMLCGEMTCEYSEASTSNLLDPVKRDWDFELIEMLGLPKDIFPEVVPPCSKAATLKPEFQKLLGCGSVEVVKVGAHDTASAVAAVPAPTDRNWAYVSCGTWALLGAELDQPLCSEEAGKAPFTNEGGLENKIRFLTNIMGTWLFQETRREWNEAYRNISFAEMEAMARDAKPLKYLVNPNDASFLTPGDMPERIRDFCEDTGQGTPKSDSEILRCIYDSLALYFRTKTAQLEKILGVEYQCLNIVGGGTKDQMLMQMTADCLGITVESGPVEATAIGNLLAQAITDGDITNLADAREVVKASFPIVEFKPNSDLKPQYDAAMVRFNEICSKTIGLSV